MFRISIGRFFADWIHVDRIGPCIDNINNFTWGKTRHGNRFKNVNGINRFRFSSYIVQVSMFMGIG